MKHIFTFASSLAPPGLMVLQCVAYRSSSHVHNYTSTRPPTDSMASRVTCLIELIFFKSGTSKMAINNSYIKKSLIVSGIDRSLSLKSLQAASHVSPEISCRHRSKGALECSKSPLLNGH